LPFRPQYLVDPLRDQRLKKNIIRNKVKPKIVHKIIHDEIPFFPQHY
jgi:hypothetical protein